MKYLLFILGGLICVGYYVTRQQEKVNIKEAIESRGAIVGMTQGDVRQSLGQPLLTKTAEKLLGKETTMTFADGNEVTFRGGKAVKIEAVKMSAEFSEARKAVATQRENASSPTGFKSRMGGSSLDRGPYIERSGRVIYTGNQDIKKLGTATETEQRDGIYNRKK